MKGIEILNLLEKGVHPIVRFNEVVEDLELQFDRNQMGRIVNAFKNKYGEIEIAISEKEYGEYNKSIEQANWPSLKDFNASPTLRYSDEHTRKEIETLCYCENDEIHEFSIVEDCYQELLDEYLASKSDLSYLDWLQEKILELRAFLN